jgi:hypothetical protein
MLDKPAEEDIRGRFLRHEGKTDSFSKFTAAYQETQPKPLYAAEEEEDAES